MKKIYLLLFIIFSSSLFIKAQCDLGNYMAAFRIPPASYPYTNGTGITVSATAVGVTLLGDVGYSCGSDMFNGSATSWWINSATATITFNFSAPVCNLTILVNGTNTTEEFYFNSNGGPVNLTNYCTTNFTLLPPGNTLLCSHTINRNLS